MEGFSPEAKKTIAKDLGVYLRTSYDAFEKVGWTVDKELKKLAVDSVSRNIVTAERMKALDKGEVLSPKRMSNLLIKADEKATIQINDLLKDVAPLTDYVAQAKRVGKLHKPC